MKLDMMACNDQIVLVEASPQYIISASAEVHNVIVQHNHILTILSSFKVVWYFIIKFNIPFDFCSVCKCKVLFFFRKIGQYNSLTASSCFDYFRYLCAPNTNMSKKSETNHLDFYTLGFTLTIVLYGTQIQEWTK